MYGYLQNEYAMGCANASKMCIKKTAWSNGNFLHNGQYAIHFKFETKNTGLCLCSQYSTRVTSAIFFPAFKSLHDISSVDTTRDRLFGRHCVVARERTSDGEATATGVKVGFACHFRHLVGFSVLLWFWFSATGHVRHRWTRKQWVVPELVPKAFIHSSASANALHWQLLPSTWIHRVPLLSIVNDVFSI